MNTTSLAIDRVKRTPALRHLVIELLWQVADDDLMIGFRDQEWLGLAPHIEEDVAFGSIGQEELGHAVHYYGLIEALTGDRADDLALLRETSARRNAVLLEQPNGAGDYLHDPHFNWAFTIVRHYLHDVWEMTVLTAMTGSVVEELAQAGTKILGEKRYHRAHQELWLRLLAAHNPQQLQDGLALASQWGADLADFGPMAIDLQQSGVLPDAPLLPKQFADEVTDAFKEMSIDLPIFQPGLNGRQGQHTAALGGALTTLSEVYRLDPGARW
ncbi:MAG: phenylacetate-CoA oxygenase subunit PaaI [Sulfobacillus acidophilus]|uniref:Phenylacetate-CoA oxygenase subunit PaaI n=1 Tax=Sulfobacillus acidophilus TaxID=53633 RepID=A0A2T2WP88_9FIRM|nr:MAG: phenylacetate-CoA oxygenase subunit PaaI [Sulfobacillus acidophilus]